jgi:hypothetical protein
VKARMNIRATHTIQWEKTKCHMSFCYSLLKQLALTLQLPSSSASTLPRSPTMRSSSSGAPEA